MEEKQGSNVENSVNTKWIGSLYLILGTLFIIE